MPPASPVKRGRSPTKSLAKKVKAKSKSPVKSKKAASPQKRLKARSKSPQKKAKSPAKKKKARSKSPQKKKARSKSPKKKAKSPAKKKKARSKSPKKKSKSPPKLCKERILKGKGKGKMRKVVCKTSTKPKVCRVRILKGKGKGKMRIVACKTNTPKTKKPMVKTPPPAGSMAAAAVAAATAAAVGGTALPATQAAQLAASQIAAGVTQLPVAAASSGSCVPRPGASSQPEYCTVAPSDFDRQTCQAAGGTLVPRDMYGQQFNYCMFSDGSSCQVEDLASGWCSRPTPSPTPVPVTKQPDATLPPWFNQQQQHPNSSGSKNQSLAMLAAMMPGMLGRAGSDYQGVDLGTPGETGGALPYGNYQQMGDPTQFFGDQMGLANTGVTDAVTSALIAQQTEQSEFGPPQPVPLVMQPGGVQSSEQPTAPPAPDGANPMLAQLVAQKITQAQTQAPGTPFFRITNPLVYIMTGVIIGVVYYAYRRFSHQKMSDV